MRAHECQQCLHSLEEDGEEGGLSGSLKRRGGRSMITCMKVTQSILNFKHGRTTMLCSYKSISMYVYTAHHFIITMSTERSTHLFLWNLQQMCTTTTWWPMHSTNVCRNNFFNMPMLGTTTLVLTNYPFLFMPSVFIKMAKHMLAVTLMYMWLLAPLKIGHLTPLYNN